MDLSKPTLVFFRHLQAEFETCQPGTELGTPSLVVGSDEERAIIKANHSGFSDSQLILATETGGRFLQRKVGADDQTKKGIM